MYVLPKYSVVVTILAAVTVCTALESEIKHDDDREVYGRYYVDNIYEAPVVDVETLVRSIRETHSEKESRCRRVGLKRCGDKLIEAAKQLDSLPESDKMNVKCALRQEFFNCLDKVSDKCMNDSSIYSEEVSEAYLEKVRDTLWTSGACATGK